jgi:hypothetical protein
VLVLAIFLIFFALISFISVSRDSGFMSLPDALFYFVAIGTVLSGILLGVLFFLKSDIPRNLGWVSIALFAILTAVIGVYVVRDESADHFFGVPGVMALLAGLYFVSRQDTWKYFRYISLSFFLVLVSLLNFGISEYYATYIFSVVTGILALLAGIFFLLRK